MQPHLAHGCVCLWSPKLPRKKPDCPKAAMLERLRGGTQGTVPAEPCLHTFFATVAKPSWTLHTS